MENQLLLRVFTKFNDSFPFERKQEGEYYEISRSKINIVIYTKILQKGLEYVARELSVMLTKCKKSFEPDSNQRPKDINNASTVLRSTN